MKTIKFRAWNKPTKQMMYWGFFTNIFDKGAADRRNFEAEHNEWMQFTGLLDKNGKEIYEGDILKKRLPKLSGDNNGHSYKTVQWTLSKTYNGFNVTDMHNWEVIGNIYENPDLLKN